MRVPEEGLVRVSGCRTFGWVVFRRRDVGSRLVGCSVGGGTRLLEAKPFLRAQSIRSDVSPHLPVPICDRDIAKLYGVTTCKLNRKVYVPIGVQFDYLFAVQKKITIFAEKGGKSEICVVQSISVGESSFFLLYIVLAASS